MKKKKKKSKINGAKMEEPVSVVKKHNPTINVCMAIILFYGFG